VLVHPGAASAELTRDRGGVEQRRRLAEQFGNAQGYRLDARGIEPGSLWRAHRSGRGGHVELPGLG
jgi:hypothetical protein